MNKFWLQQFYFPFRGITSTQWRNNRVAGRVKCDEPPGREGREHRRILTLIITKLIWRRAPSDEFVTGPNGIVTPLRLSSLYIHSPSPFSCFYLIILIFILMSCCKICLISFKTSSDSFYYFLEKRHKQKISNHPFNLNKCSNK